VQLDQGARQSVNTSSINPATSVRMAAAAATRSTGGVQARSAVKLICGLFGCVLTSTMGGDYVAWDHVVAVKYSSVKAAAAACDGVAQCQ
jgi:hypothetical protein